MEPQGGSVSPLRTRRPNRALGLSKTTLRSRVHVQTVGLNAATKKDRHRAGRGGVHLDIPFYRTCPMTRLHRSHWFLAPCLVTQRTRQKSNEPKDAPNA